MIPTILSTPRACLILGLYLSVGLLGACGTTPQNMPETPTDPEPLAEGIFARQGDPLPTATAEQLEAFERGKAVSLRRFDLADGLGPDFNVTFCTACHERPTVGGSAGLYRNFFLAGTLTADGAFITDDFGGVIRKDRYSSVAGDFFPPIPESLNVFAQRTAIPFFGVGLIAELSDEEILSRVDENDADGDGISGRANFDQGFVGRFGRKSQTVSIEGFIRGPLNNHLGITTDPLTEEQRARLPVDSSLASIGLAAKHKPNRAATVRERTSATSTSTHPPPHTNPTESHPGDNPLAARYIPNRAATVRERTSATSSPNCSTDAAETQPCDLPLSRTRPKPTAVLQAAAPDGPLTDFDATPDPEMPSEDLFDLVSFAMLLAAPQPEDPTEQTIRGQATFEEIGCTGCHVSRIIGPRGALPIYSDLLLHDMGPELADGIVQGDASGSEFRTQPLWGLASVGPYLHDGRAETIGAAILAHGGEGEASRDRYAALDASEQTDLIEFLLSLGGRDQYSTGLIPPNTPIADVGSFAGPRRELTTQEAARFLAGRELFDREFGHETGAGALSTPGGPPRFNGDSCRACHFEPTIGGAGPRGLNVMRHGRVDDGGAFSPPTTTPNTILHTQTISLTSGNVPEAGINVFEPRQPPHTFGLGLIDAIADETILAGADDDDADGDGISGRAHVIVDAVGTRVGRLGWKAQVPNIGEFVRDAMAAEIGLTLPEQTDLIFGITADDDGMLDPELSLTEAEDLAFFIEMLAPPPRQPGATSAEALRGEQVFSEVGCDKCHTPTLVATVDGATLDVPLYSDLLLHEILPEGTPGIEDGLANQREFRTSPLWGLSQTSPYFHTGEADTIDEAIRLHAGEATAIIDAYDELSSSDREALLAFLETL